MTRMGRLARRVIRNAHDDSGTSLAELSVTMLLLSVIMAVSYQSVASLSEAVAGTDRRVENLGEARHLMKVTSRDLRTATRLQAGTSAFVTADAKDVVFYANLNNPTSGPRRVRIYVDTQTRLIEEVTPPDASSVAPNYTYLVGPVTTRLVGKYVANAPSQPIFTYYDVNGTELTSVPLNAADLLAVRQVKIALSIRRSTVLNVGLTTLENRVRLPNLDYQTALAG